jgi:hypothetical protein
MIHAIRASGAHGSHALARPQRRPWPVLGRSLWLLWLVPSVLACKSPRFEFDHTATDAASGGTTSIGTGVGGTAADAGAAGQGGGAGQAGAPAGEVTATSGSVTGGPYDTGAEDCLNGVDDDDDGAVDCEDSDCSPFFYCVPSVPEGWEGPVALWEGAGVAPGCDSYYPVGAATLPSRLLAPAEPNLCPECSCTSPSAALCSSASLEYFADADCGESLGSVEVGEACSAASVSHAAGARPVAARFAPRQDLSVECSAVADGVPVSPPVALEKVRACGQPGLTGLGCQSKQHCLPRPLPPFASSICIHKRGEFDCPAGFPEARPRYYQVASDGRFCRPCLCGAVTCRGSVSDSTDDFCSSTTTNISPGQCVPVAEDDSMGADTRSVSFDAEAGAACSSAGPSRPDGDYTLTSPVSYCCLPL